MKRNSILGVALIAASAVSAQEMNDAYRYNKKDIVGTARYMGMAGAFGALGGDISTLSQNPAGIGVYRSSEVVATLSLGGVETSSSMPANSYGIEGPSVTNGKFNANCNNLGYVGTFKTGRREGLVNFNVGFAFNRQGGEKRKYGVTQNYMQSSLSDYIALRATNWGGAPSKLLLQEGSSYDPYFDSDAPWLAIMGYNTGTILSNGGGSYSGLYSTPSEVAVFAIDGDLMVEEKSRIDEYTFNVGGNFSNMVYWGLGIGIMDLNFEQRSYYDEYFYDTTDPNQTLGTPTNYRLDNYLKTSGTGINIKAGLIFRPVNAVRIGVAVHTPTWYRMSDSFGAEMEAYNKQPQAVWDIVNTPNDGFDYRMNTPWTYQFSTAFVIGKSGLLSFEYDLEDFSTVKLSDDGGYDIDYVDINKDINNYLKARNTFKVGGEWRLTSNTSFRLGYANQSSAYDKKVKDDEVQIYASGTLTNYVIDRGTQYYTGGLGYRMGSVFADMAFVWSSNRQDAYLFPALGSNVSQRSRLKTDTYKFLVTLGYKF